MCVIVCTYRTHDIIRQEGWLMEKTNKRLKKTWYSMIYRCHGKNLSPKTALYYRDKGITVCDEWKESFAVFEKWAMENGYDDNLTIDRIDPCKNYCPENCQWITKSENSRKAASDKRKNATSEHDAKFGHFMVIEEIEQKILGYSFKMYKVIQTGLYKSEANMIARKLNGDLPPWERRYSSRVTLDCKVGQIVPWEKTGQYLNSRTQTQLI